MISYVLHTNVRGRATLVTDESSLYKLVGTGYADHQTVPHAGREYVNKDGYTTNNIENFFGVFKRGIRSVYHFCGEQHLKRYLDEFPFRYSNRAGVGSNDAMHAELALKGISGKRLTYRQTDQDQELRNSSRNASWLGGLKDVSP
jgi:hypothetical protein